MSQKSTRRARRQTNDEEPAPLKTTPPPKTNDSETPEESQENSQTVQQQEVVEQNGTTEKETNEAETSIVTRSRSATPQVSKKTATQNGHGDEEEVKPTEEVEEPPQQPEEVQEELNTSMKENTDTEMDPLIVSDEPDPELEFEEENSDVESGKSSPIIVSRCKTRRSQTRNIPTPKTPKCVEEADSVGTSSKEEEQDLNATFESCTDDVSTKAEAGSDSTRLNYTTDKDFSLDNNSFLQGTKDKSFGEALRCLSTRRTIRPISEDYRKKLLKTSLSNKSNKTTDFESSYPSRNSVESVSAVSGTKRKGRESDEGIGKRFKSEEGFFSRLTSPLSSIRNTFRSEIPSSTPKLTGYKDDKFLLEEEGMVNSQMCELSDGERRWCSIM